jgi:hypothetical protein
MFWLDCQSSCPACAINRRQFFRTGAYLVAAVATGLTLPGLAAGAAKSPWSLSLAPNGSTEPLPIPWLDKNGSHNQSPGPNQDPSNIYNFKGRVARCNNFTGTGTDNQGNRIAFGTPSTDFSFMQGEYFAGRDSRFGTFSHI